MSAPEIYRLLEYAERQLARGHVTGAIETLKGTLTGDPDCADAHALLALCLVRQKRLHAADLESRMALALEPEAPLAHWACGAVLTARRRFREAEEHYNRFLELRPEDGDGYRALAELRRLTGHLDEARALLEKALELDPENPDTLTDLGELALSRGDGKTAELRAREALELEPEHQSALVLMGHAALHRGDVETAREHALWALRIDPTAHGPLYLLSSIKARSNPLLGLWWRYQTWIGSLGDGRAIVVLLGAFVLYRLALIWAGQSGYASWSGPIQIGWLALCAYTWFAPALFARSVAKELRTVQLRDDY